jgi:hypothetical protein
VCPDEASEQWTIWGSGLVWYIDEEAVCRVELKLHAGYLAMRVILSRAQ